MNWITVAPTEEQASIHFLPGRLLKFDDLTIGLVGHINESGGTCNCCGEFRDVVAYSDDLVPLLEAAQE